MKAKIGIILSILLVIALFVCMGIFFSHNTDRVEELFNDTVKALDTENGLKVLFTPTAVDNTKTLDLQIDRVNKFYVGKSVEVKDFTIYRESNNIYRMNATVKTDGGEYFVSLAGCGARRVDPYGIDQLIIEDNQEFQHKNLFKKKQFDKYLEHAKEFGITIRTKGDR
ncbi:MAG: DUF5104 domain-containing protein [Ruminococcus sp.]|nr:DUF5104 domain-containing protein [Ruminococcus sp.]